MNSYIKIFLFIFYSIAVLAQEIRIEHIKTINNFVDAVSIAADQYKNIYVIDAGTNQIIKYSDNYKKISSFGGYGWGDNSFDEPTDIAISFDLFIYICDYNNHRIQHFDRNLNYVSTITGKGKEYNFGYPRSIAISKQGELFFIDGENQRIIKLDAFRNYVTDFGGIRSGKGNLYDPYKIRIGFDNFIYVIDGEKLISFDNFGNYLNSFDTDKHLIGITFYNDNILLLEKEAIIVKNKNFNEVNIFDIKNLFNDKENLSDLIIRDIFVFNDKLYLLSNKKLFIFNITIN